MWLARKLLLKKLMRLPRLIQLYQEQGSVHKYWRCHNKEFLLEHIEAKRNYLNSTKYALNHASVRKSVKINAYCLMNNHSHMKIKYLGGADYLSKFMRISHGIFGAKFNKMNNRTGKVANERPKTSLIESHEYDMKVHFYIEANPIRAGFIKKEKLKFYKFSSYRFYAHGIKDEWTEMLTIPEWYLSLGSTSSERQKKYRHLFESYLKSESLDSSWIFQKFIGSTEWQFESQINIKKYLQSSLTMSTNSS